MKRAYITTPIYYSSGQPHIGHAYTTIIADTIAKFKKKIGYEVFFITGMDEHGLKIQQKAQELNMTPKALVDKYSIIFKDLWKTLGIEYDQFIRTSSSFHKKAVQAVFSDLLKKEFIYLGVWKGLYCVSCEENYTKALATKKENDPILYCAQGHKLVEKEEESYFLKIKQFNSYISSFIKDPDLIYPISRVNELKNSFLSNDNFEDLSISRTTFSWGIPVSENPKHVIYVWLDALLNYLTGLGYKQSDDSNYQKFWQDENCQVIQLMSKEITRFHCIYWPIVLEMLKLRKPSRYISHGWIITKEGKMSKSFGNVLDPLYFVNKYGRDAFRYYLVSEFSFKNDNVFSEENFIDVFNSQLANNVGNFYNRLLGMLNKYNNGIFPKYQQTKEKAFLNFEKIIKTFDYQIVDVIETLDLQNVVKTINKLIDDCNLFIENNKPWNLSKENSYDKLNEFLSLLGNAAKRVIYYLEPILVDGCNEARNQFNISKNKWNKEFVNDFSSLDGLKINIGKPIYLRITK